MKSVLTTVAFFVSVLFVVSSMFAIFGTSPDISTSETVPQVVPAEGVGVAVADTHRLSGTYPVEDFTGEIAYKVLRVIDGDTVKIDANGKATTVRLIGVDTPETVHPSKPVEAYGKEASNFTKNLLLGESVYLRYDVERTDTYGRLLAYLYRVPDGLFVNLEIVRQGYGHAYTRFPFKHMEVFRHYGQRARAAGKGLYEDTKARVVSEGDAAPAVASESEAKVYVTRTGKKYHREGCSSLRRSKIPISLAAAKQRYGPCGLCNPPR